MLRSLWKYFETSLPKHLFYKLIEKMPWCHKVSDANYKVTTFYWGYFKQMKSRPEFFALHVKSTQGSWLDKKYKTNNHQYKKKKYDKNWNN